MSKRLTALAVGFVVAVVWLAVIAGGSSLAPAAPKRDSRVTVHFRERATGITVTADPGYPSPGTSVRIYGRFKMRYDGKRTHGMWWRKLTVRKQVSPTEFVGTGVGETFLPTGTHRDRIPRFRFRLAAGGSVTSGRIEFFPGTGLFRHVRGAARFKAAVGDPAAPFTVTVRGWASYRPADGWSKPARRQPRFVG